MSRKTTIILLSVLTVIGSVFAMFTNNLFFSDIMNMPNLRYFPVTLAASSITGIFVVAVFFLIRFYLHPKTLKRLSRLYLIICGALALMGLIGSILTGAVVYKNFLAPYPFKGFTLTFLALNLMILAGCVVGIIFNRKLPEDEERQKIDAKYVFKTIGWFLFISLVFNRLGNLLTVPAYAYWRLLFLTFPFYLYLFVPIYIAVLVVLVKLDVLNKKQRMITSIVALAVNVVLFVVVVIINVNNTMAVSAVSQTMPLERLLSKPIELPIHFVAYTAVGLILLLPTVLKKKEQTPVEAQPVAE